ncbi:MAG: 50S ribosomal protein L21, partial [Flammeovirgaceae bacterium]|nr:50S ribosomal protein L21 [Flammeovirgaceae bacterium]
MGIIVALLLIIILIQSIKIYLDYQENVEVTEQLSTTEEELATTLQRLTEISAELDQKILEIEKLGGEPGELIHFSDVLAVGTGENAEIGAPLVSGATVTAEIVEQGRARKVIAFKKRRRQNSRIEGKVNRLARTATSCTCWCGKLPW